MSTSTLFPEPATPSTGPLTNLEPHVALLATLKKNGTGATRLVVTWPSGS